jgi:hypothetical protein
MRILLAAFVGLVLHNTAFAQDLPPKPPELETLGQYVGHWTSDVTSKPTVSAQKGKKFDAVSHAEMILDGWFLQQVDVKHVVGAPEQMTKSLSQWTWDARSEKFLVWMFESDGSAVSWTGEWDSASRRFTFVPAQPLPKKIGKLTDQFVDANTVVGSLTFIDDAGKTLTDLAWSRKRQAESDGKATLGEWDRISAHTRPVPHDLAKLEPLIGEWDAEFIDGPSAVSPELGVSKGKLTAKWILDRHFLLGTTEQDNERSIWIIGSHVYTDGKNYETKYRRVRFTNSGQVDEALGVWNGEFDTIDWLIHIKRPGSPRHSITQDYIGVEGSDRLRANILIRDAEEKKINRSVTTKATRRK